MSEFIDVKIEIDVDNLKNQLSLNGYDFDATKLELLINHLHKTTLTITYDEFDSSVNSYAVDDNLIVTDDNLHLVNQKVHYE